MLHKAFRKLFKSHNKSSIPKIDAALQLRHKNYFWNPKENIPNIGDYLAFETVSFFLNLRDRHSLDIETGKILSIGSVLHFANDNDVIWGSGRNGKIGDEKHSFTHLDVRAVRGPLTKDFLQSKGIEAPSVFGDPGILAPLIYPVDLLHTVTPKESEDFLIVPQLNDDMSIYSKFDNKLVSPRQLPGNFITKLTKAKRVVASSLHGLILAEAYGIPATFFNSGSGETLFKYEDYYKGTGREDFVIANSIEECLEKEPTPPIPNLADRQRKLISTFPYDKYMPSPSES